MNLVNIDNIRTTKQVAKMLRCTTRYVAMLVKKEKLPTIKKLDNTWFLFDVNDVVVLKFPI